MAKNITILGASYQEVPAVTLPKTGGGTATFIDQDEVVTYHVSSSTPTNAQGNDGDIWLVTS